MILRTRAGQIRSPFLWLMTPCVWALYITVMVGRAVIGWAEVINTKRKAG